MNEETAKNPLSTEPYKGVRDFYPEDMFIQNHIFGTRRTVVESFGFTEYGASILEPTELYKAKSGEEIVNEQTYSFKDRGDRDVTLRPEMTPTITRMIAAKRRELPTPIRWYSIPNLFRYEKPQRGRLREHYQLNVDLFGVENTTAEIEVLSLISAIMKKFGASEKDFVIKVNNRKILNYMLSEVLELSADNAYKAMKLIDRKAKMPATDFKSQADEIVGEKAPLFISLLSATSIEDFKNRAADAGSDILGVSEVMSLIDTLKKLGVSNVAFDPTLARGFDYYTGIVFEVNDVDERNTRSLFGGGRFDDLLSVFGTDKLPAVGFGMGDVTLRDFLETHELLPAYKPTAELLIATVGTDSDMHALELANKLRHLNLSVTLDTTDRKIGKKFEATEKQKIPFVLVLGEDEVNNKTFTIKELATRTETKCSSETEIIALIAKQK
jgi:histidyl-tRNA synthetase